MPSVEKIRDVIRTVDAGVTSAVENPADTDPRLLNGFTGGNLHRISPERLGMFEETMKRAFGR
jgi:hypothetical protein